VIARALDVRLEQVLVGPHRVFHEQRELVRGQGSVGTPARSMLCSGDHGSGTSSFAVTSWRSASSATASSRRSPRSIRSAVRAHAAASRSAVIVTTRYDAPEPCACFRK
jgi:hypothetical protein